MAAIWRSAPVRPKKWNHTPAMVTPTAAGAREGGGGHPLGASRTPAAAAPPPPPPPPGSGRRRKIHLARGGVAPVRPPSPPAVRPAGSSDEQAALRRRAFLLLLRPKAKRKFFSGTYILLTHQSNPPVWRRRRIANWFCVRGGGYGDYPEDQESAKEVADHYSRRTNQTLREREKSPIIHLKKLNNWIKSVLIKLYASPGDSVLDLACGKGGDLKKWKEAEVGYYVGVDIAEGSIKDCMTRYNGDKLSFPARLICADCYETQLDEYLAEDAPFDICSCHTCKTALANISALLRPGGTFIGTMPDANIIIKRLRATEAMEFGNSVYCITFREEYTEKKFPASRPFGIKYKFYLEDAVDCPEWVVPFHLFKLLAEEYDLELVLMKNFHEFVHEHLQKPEFDDLTRRLGTLGDGRHGGSTLSQDEWEVSYLYLAFVMRKRGPPSSQFRVSEANRGKTFLAEEDIEFLLI